jgi:hypothetical protein
LASENLPVIVLTMPCPSLERRFAATLPPSIMVRERKELRQKRKLKPAPQRPVQQRSDSAASRGAASLAERTGTLFLARREAVIPRA